MLQNAYFLAKIGADTTENEQHFAEILPKTVTNRMRAYWPRSTSPDPPLRWRLAFKSSKKSSQYADDTAPEYC